MRALLVLAAAATLTVQAHAADVLPLYKVVAEEKTDTSRTVDVRIERRIDEADVSAIANAIVNRETKPFNRTVVNFVLPLAKPGEPPWASASLIRELKVRIPGLRLDEERQFVAEALADRRDVIGAWLTSTPATPGRLTIYRENRRVYAEWRMRSGVRTQDEVSETRTSAGRRFDLKSAANEDHFVILAGGDLEIRAKGAVIAIGERIKDSPAAAAPVVSARDHNTEVASWPPVPTSTIEPRRVIAPAEGREAITSAAIADPAAKPAKQGKAPGSPTPRKQSAQPTAPKIDLTRFLQPQT